MGFVKFIQSILVIAGFIVPLASLAEIEHDEQGAGEKKKSQVVADLKEQMKVANIKLPSWIEKYTDLLLGLVVDVVVMIMNKFGFFEHGQTLPAE